MHPLYHEFVTYLDREDKAKCIELALSNLDKRQLDIVTLYIEILTPSLNVDFSQTATKEICIWKEHVRTSIIRTIIECCYPHIMEEQKRTVGSVSKGKVVVLCPPGELHEIGARMVNDFFTLCGFDTIFVGANTPQEDIINGIKYVQPRYVAISVTDYYNLVSARKALKSILDLKETLTFDVILGGQACQRNTETCQQMGPVRILNSFQEIQQLPER